MTEYERRARPLPRPARRPSARSRPAASSRPSARAAVPSRRRISHPATARTPRRSTTTRPAAAATARTSRFRRPTGRPFTIPWTRDKRVSSYRPAAGRRPYPRWPRRRWPHRWGWRYDGWPSTGLVDYPAEDVYTSASEPDDLPPALSSIPAQGQRALQRAGLLTGAWQQRLDGAPSELHHFIRRFCRTAGFEFVVLRSFGSPMQRGAAVLAIRLAARIAARIPDFRQRLVFADAIGIAPGGVYLSLRLELDDRHYQLLPWSSLDPRAVRQQLARDTAHYRGTESIRWVFSTRRLGGMPKETVVAQLREILGGGERSYDEDLLSEPAPGRVRANGNGANGRHTSAGMPNLNRLVIVL